MTTKADAEIRAIHNRLKKTHDLSWTDIAILTAKVYAQNLLAENIMLKQHNGQLNSMLDNKLKTNK